MINVCGLGAQTHRGFSLGAIEIRRCVRGQQNSKRGCEWQTGRFIQGMGPCPFWQVVKGGAALSFGSVQNFKVKISRDSLFPQLLSKVQKNIKTRLSPVKISGGIDDT